MKRILASILVMVSFAAHADDAVTVQNAEQLNWQIHSSGKVYLQNLSQFDSTFLGCCYNYYIDTATVGGRTMWSAVLTQIAAGKSVTFTVSSKTQAGPVTYLSP